jgi:hypothetical protein
MEVQDNEHPTPLHRAALVEGIFTRKKVPVQFAFDVTV